MMKQFFLPSAVICFAMTGLAAGDDPAPKLVDADDTAAWTTRVQEALNSTVEAKKAYDAATKKLIKIHGDLTALKSCLGALSDAQDRAKDAEDAMVTSNKQLHREKTAMAAAAEMDCPAAEGAESAEEESAPAAADREPAAEDDAEPADGDATPAENLETAVKDAQNDLREARAKIELEQLTSQSFLDDICQKRDEAVPQLDAVETKNKEVLKALRDVLGEKESEEPAAEVPDQPAGGTSMRDAAPATEALPAATTDSAATAQVDAFSRRPLVQVVPVAENLAAFGLQDNASSVGESKNEFVCDYRFDAPAHFPLTSYGPYGQVIETEGALIYEGMQFAINTDGQYQIRFVVGTPAMPVTMRLQLILADHSTGNRYTLTLPPITIPEKDKPQFTAVQSPTPPVYANIQTVHHEGYLPVLAGNAGQIHVVRRQGTARFGFGVDVP